MFQRAIIAAMLAVYIGVVLAAREAYHAATPCVVPQVAPGVAMSVAVHALSDAHCERGSIIRVTSSQRIGSFVSFNLAPGIEQAHGTAVTIAISAGECRVPKLPGTEMESEAVRHMRRFGCDARVQRIRSAARPGRVLSIGARAGSQWARGATVRINVSAGLAPTAKQFTAAENYARARSGHVSWAVVDADGEVRSFNGDQQYRCASLAKALILVARLRQLGAREIPAGTHSDLSSMIRVSNNDAASRQFQLPGMADEVRNLAHEAGMTGFLMPNPFDWGVIRFTAVDQAKLFSRIDQLIPEKHRSWAMNELRSVTPAQRWGIARFADESPQHWQVAFKGGWLSSPCGGIQHQAALLTRPGERLGVAVLTDCNPGAGYGQQTQLEVATRLFSFSGT